LGVSVLFLSLKITKYQIPNSTLSKNQKKIEGKRRRRKRKTDAFHLPLSTLRAFRQQTAALQNWKKETTETKAGSFM